GESVLSLVVDAAGGAHAAFSCSGVIRVAESSDAGRTWHVTEVTPPAGEKDLDPKVAVDATTLYVGYTRVVPDEGCGSTGSTSVSVAYRSRPLAGGAWASGHSFGASGDHVDVIVAAGGTLHFAIEDPTRVAYVAIHGGTTQLTTITKEVGVAAPGLAVAGNGTVHVADQVAKGVGFGTLGTSGFSTVIVPSSDAGWAPLLAQAAGNAMDLVWVRAPEPGGCATRDSEPRDGIYFGTNAGGTWKVTRVTTDTGTVALAVAPTSGRAHVLVSGDDPNSCCPMSPGTLTDYVGRGSGPWAKTVLLPTTVSSSVIGIEPSTGKPIVLYQDEALDGSSFQVLALSGS
ncbi:MAG: hypothetical protein ACRDGI_09475, partial [Candidatus Limnocylindrales bacterium]